MFKKVFVFFMCLILIGLSIAYGISPATPTDLEPTEPEPTITYPFTVTYVFYYRGANANWKSVSSSQKVTGPDFYNSKAVSFFSKQITNNNLQTVSSDTTIYTWLGTWSGALGTVSDGDKVYTNATLFQTDTTIEFRANYSEKSVAHLNFIYNDNIANGSGSWANTDRFVGYTHTFSSPPDIPNHYEFLYWTDGNEQFRSGQSKTIREDDIEGEATMTYVAVYNYQPGIIINYHYGNNISTVVSYEDTNIYANAPISATWYLNNTDALGVDYIVNLPKKIQTTTLLNDMISIDVYANFKVSWVNYDKTLLECDNKVPYGVMPEFNGSTPTRASTKTTTYTFSGWKPKIMPVTADITYTAVYDKVKIKPSPKPTPTSKPTKKPTPKPTATPSPTPQNDISGYFISIGLFNQAGDCIE